MGPTFDVAVVGAGIVGLATADALLTRWPDLKLLLLEKEADVSKHQTGNNSGVVHAGIYYRPGTLRAQLCVQGVEMLREFCANEGVLYDRVGKVIVATEPVELPRLDALLARGQENRVPGLRMIETDELREIEPHAAGLRAIHSPNTAIVDYPGVCRALLRRIRARGATVVFGSEVLGLDHTQDGLSIRTQTSRYNAQRLITCGGLHADRIARMNGITPSVQIVPFRGEYYFLKPERNDLVRGLIYPVPDPALPFLGVHFTRTVHGEVEAGPNAVFAFAREGYGWTKINPRDMAETFAYGGFWRLAARVWKIGAFEMYRSLSKAAFVESLQKLVPSVRSDDVRRGGAGVRAQAVDAEGKLIDDFAFAESERALHVLNAPSPAATACLAIGEHLAERVEGWFQA